MHFGYEKEGLFDAEYDERDEDDERCYSYFRHDGSVEASESYEGDYSDVVDGEIASPKFRIDRLLQFRQFEKDNEMLWSDDTCGIHIHVSTNNALAFQKLCDLQFHHFDLYFSSQKIFFYLYQLKLDLYQSWFQVY